MVPAMEAGSPAQQASAKYCLSTLQQYAVVNARHTVKIKQEPRNSTRTNTIINESITANWAHFHSLPFHCLLMLLIALCSLLQLLLHALFSGTRGSCISLSLKKRKTSGVSAFFPGKKKKQVHTRGHKNCSIKLSGGMHLLPYGLLLLSLQLEQTLAFGLARTLALSFLFVKNNLINAY
jgi:hypothetical protein